MLLTWLPCLLALQVLTVHSVTQPNIVMMVADDLGWLLASWITIILILLYSVNIHTAHRLLSYWVIT